MFNKKADDFIWEIFCNELFGKGLKVSAERKLYFPEKDYELPADIKRLVIDYEVSRDRELLFLMAVLMLKRFSFNAEYRTRLIAYLLSEKKITLKQAYSFLTFDGVNEGELSPLVRKVADTYWLLRQDAVDNFLSPTDDDLLLAALRDLVNEI